MANPTSAVASEAAAAVSFFLVAASIIFVYFWFSTNSKHKTSPSPPGPWGLPILGYLPFLHSDLHRHFAKLARVYGPIYKLHLGSKVCVVISSVPLIKQVVRDQDAIFANRDPPIAALVFTGSKGLVWSPNGPYYREMRKMLAWEILNTRNLQASYQLRRREVRKVVRDLSVQEGNTIRISVLIFLTELNVIMNLLLGGTLKEKMGDEFRERVVKIVELLGKPNVSDFFPVLARFDIQRVARDMKENMEVVERILDSFIHERMVMMEEEEEGEGEKRKDYLQIMLELKKRKSQESLEGSSFGLCQIKALLMDIVVGGTDTTAAIVEWVMSELLHHPDVMERVQKEVDDVVGIDATIEETHIPRLHYLDAVVKETFRLHPPVPLLVPRSPSQTCDIGGYKVPKGSRVLLNAWSNHMDPHLWENPSEFRPERFMGDEGGKFDYMGNSFEFLPFGSGRRVCPGLALAQRMMMYLLATLVHSFDWRLAEGEKMDLSETFGIVMRKKTPLTAVPYRRLADANLYM